MSWIERYGDKLRSAEEAVRVVKSGDKVYAGLFHATAYTLCQALLARAHKGEIDDVTVFHHLSPVQWVTPETEGRIRLVSAFAGPFDRRPLQEGLADFMPTGCYKRGTLPPGQHVDIDVMLVPVSPPDRNGYCSFGHWLFFARTAASLSRVVIGEVIPDAIRTFGENYIHVSEIDYLVESGGSPPPPIPRRSDEVVAAAEVICTLVANELIRDGDTLQTGIGDVSAALAMYLEGKHDLGIHSELIPGGIVDLVDKGVVTGRYKSVYPNKVVGSAVVQVPRQELERIDMNPDFELYEFSYTDDLGLLTRLENFVAINNALEVDLTGQVSAEAFGTKVFSGQGGQSVFAMAAAYSSGRSITVLPSSLVVDGQRVSRIRAAFPPGQLVTVQRTFVDYVVTEQGIASLRGKTVRQRIGEMISVAHPDFRAELKVEGRHLYGVDV